MRRVDGASAHAAPDAPLAALDREFASEDSLWVHSRRTLGLSDAEFRQVSLNVQMAAAIVRESCKVGRLRFDLEPEAFLLRGSVRGRAVDCDNP